MSAPYSDRSEARVGDLRGSVIDRLEAHEPIVTLLELTETVDDAAAVILPRGRLRRETTDDDYDTPGVAVGVGVVTGSSERENHHERKRLVVQTTIQFREKTLDYYGDSWADDVRDEISAVLTAHESPWIAGGESGGRFEALWNESANRYTVDQQFDVQSID